MFTILDVLPHIEDFINEQVLCHLHSNVSIVLVTMVKMAFGPLGSTHRLTINTSTMMSIADHHLLVSYDDDDECHNS